MGFPLAQQPSNCQPIIQHQRVEHTLITSWSAYFICYCSYLLFQNYANSKHSKIPDLLKIKPKMQATPNKTSTFLWPALPKTSLYP